MSLGSDVRDRRRAMHLTQQQLADLAGVSDRFVRSVEQDKPSVQLDKLASVLEALGLELRAHSREASRDQRPAQRPGR